MALREADREILETLKALDTVSYLRSNGWTSSESKEGLYSIWNIEKDDEEFEVFVPAPQNKSAYALRMSELLKTLSAVEQRSQIQILRDIQGAKFDSLRVRLASSGRDGIQLIRGVNAFEGSRDLILAAASSAHKCRAVHPSRKPDLIRNYMDTVRYGHTEEGSFIISILCPVPPLMQKVMFDSAPEDPFERKVTKTLMQSLAAVQRAAESSALSGTFQAFEESVKIGVSADLCEAINKLFMGSEADIELAMNWSPLRRVEERIPSRVTVSNDAVSLIAQASQTFREQAPEEDSILSGFITGLSRSETDTLGLVTLTDMSTGKPRKIRIELKESLYSEALRAHERRLPVNISGDVVRRGRSFVLERSHDFEVLDTSPENAEVS